MEKVIKVLLIEDDPLDQIQVQRALDQKGILYKMKVTKNGEEGISFLENGIDVEFKGLPDIILLDINMPKMNGLEFLSTFRKNEAWSNIKVFVLTTSEQEKRAVAKVGVSGYIVKPLKFNSPSMDTFNLMIDMMNLQVEP